MTGASFWPKPKAGPVTWRSGTRMPVGRSIGLPMPPARSANLRLDRGLAGHGGVDGVLRLLHRDFAPGRRLAQRWPERTATGRKMAITAISQSDWPGQVTKDGRSVRRRRLHCGFVRQAPFDCGGSRLLRGGGGGRIGPAAPGHREAGFGETVRDQRHELRSDVAALEVGDDALAIVGLEFSTAATASAAWSTSPRLAAAAATAAWP